MRWPLIAIVLTTACSQQPNHLGNLLLLPFNGLGAMFDNAAYDTRRGAVEVIVKSNDTAIQSDIRSGGGPILTQAMDAARIPLGDRPARIIQLQSDIGLYEATPGALVTALMVYGS